MSEMGLVRFRWSIRFLFKNGQSYRRTLKFAAVELQPHRRNRECALSLRSDHVSEIDTERSLAIQRLHSRRLAGKSNRKTICRDVWRFCHSDVSDFYFQLNGLGDGSMLAGQNCLNL